MAELEKPKREKKSALSVVDKTDLETLLARLNDEYAVILRGSQVLIMRHWVGEDETSKLVFLSRRDFLLLQENNKLFVDDGAGAKKPLKIAQTWIEWGKRQTYEEVYFEPCGRTYKSRYNLWRGFAVKPQQNKGKFDIFLDHVLNNICQGDKEHYGWVMAWLADIFQKPNRKLGTSLVLRGPMGVGKGQFAYHIGRLLGIHYMPVTQASQLTGKFNGHMADKLLMFIDEGWWSDERNGAGILRALITETEVTVEMKGKDAITIPNFTRFIIAANADWVVPLGMGDERRFMMLDVGTLVQRDTAYFAEMDAQLNAGGYEALLHYLLHYQYDEMVPRNIISTEALVENKIYSLSDEMKWWYEVLRQGMIGKFTLLDQENSNYILTNQFFETYNEWCNIMRVKPLSSNVLPKKLKTVLHFDKREGFTEISKRGQFYHFKTISTLRDSFEVFLGAKIDWNEF